MQIAWSAGLWSGAGKPLPAKRLNADDGADHVAVHINIADPGARDWRTDFTIAIAPADRRALEPECFDITALKGRFIRVRCWLKFFNGPMIEATHLDQVEDVK